MGSRKSHNYFGRAVSMEYANNSYSIPGSTGIKGKALPEEEVLRFCQRDKRYAYRPPQEVVQSLGGSFSEKVFLRDKAVTILAEHLSDEIDPIRLLEDSWRFAYANGLLRYFRNQVYFPLLASTVDSLSPMEVSIQPADPDSVRPHVKEWFLQYVGYRRRQEIGGLPAQMFDFAYFPNYARMLERVAKAALPEPWFFGRNEPKENRKRFEILDNYLRNTYIKLVHEKKILIDEDEGIAVFNSGLVTKLYEDILLCFKRNNKIGAQPWVFDSICELNVGQKGKMVAAVFGRAPEPANYFQSSDQKVLDIADAKRVNLVKRHIIGDHLDRWPCHCLNTVFASDEKARALYQRAVDSKVATERDASFRDLGDYVVDTPALFNQFEWIVGGAYEKALKRLRWNYKTAVPMYYPRWNQMGFLLPLSLTNPDDIDLALVISRRGDIYTGETVLTRRQAYCDARLVCRPDSDWLTTG